MTTSISNQDSSPKELVKASGSSFAPAMRLLPPARRDAMFALYAFCRVVDDIADEEGTRDEKFRGLAEWRVKIAALFAGKAECAIT